MKDKSKVLKTYGYMFDKLQFLRQYLKFITLLLQPFNRTWQGIKQFVLATQGIMEGYNTAIARIMSHIAQHITTGSNAWNNHA